MKIRQFDNYDSFACLGGPCPDNCCIGDELVLDEAVYRYYMAVPGPFGDRLRSTLAEAVRRDDFEEEAGRSSDTADRAVNDRYLPASPDDPAESMCVAGEGNLCLDAADRSDYEEAGRPGISYCLEVNGRCPFLDDDNYCSIVRHLGEDALSDVCAGFPRTEDVFAGALERGLMAACPEEARRLLTREDPLRIIEYESDEWLYEGDLTGEAGDIDDAGGSDVMHDGDANSSGNAGESDVMHDGDANSSGNAGESDVMEDTGAAYEIALLECRARVIETLQDRSQPLADRLRKAFELAGHESYVNHDGSAESGKYYVNLIEELTRDPNQSDTVDVSDSADVSDPAGVSRAADVYELTGGAARRLAILLDLPWDHAIWPEAMAALTAYCDAIDRGEPALCQPPLLLYKSAGSSAVENLLVSDVYRLFPWTLDGGEPRDALAIAVFSLLVRHDLALAFTYQESRSPEAADLIRGVTTWSKELDFSEENLFYLFSAIQEFRFM